MKKSIKKLILGLAIFVSSLGLLPSFVALAASTPSVDASATCEVLSVDLKKFPNAEPAQPAVPEISHMEYLWKHKNNSNTQWAVTAPNNNYQLAVPNQSRLVVTQQAQAAQPAKNNTVKVTIDASVVENTTFSATFSKNYPFADKYAAHSYKVEAVAWDSPNNTIVTTGTSVPCDNDTVKKIAFCHATASATNPYNYIDTSVSAFFNAGHDTHQNYEDIVPPFTYVKQGQTITFAGLNWNAAGQAIFNNGCTVPVTKVAAFSVSTLPATCDNGEKLVYGQSANVVISGTADGTYGAGAYQVTADAVAGAQFSNGNATLTLTGNLAGPLTGEVCEEDEEQPTILESTAVVHIIPATCEAGDILKYTDSDAVNATFDAASTPTNTEGVQNYEVIVNADKDAAFAAGAGVSDDGATLTFSGTLNGPLTGDDCVLGEETPKDTTPPAVLPNTTAGNSGVIALIAGSILALAAGIVARRLTSRGL